MDSFRYVIADVFSDRPLAGNQLAVFTNGQEIPEHLLQPLAKEIGFSETVFCYPADGEGHARIRIFTPASEIPFAGHPTLGTAFVLGAPLQLGLIRLETGSGLVAVELERGESGRIVFGRMSQPLPRIEQYRRAGELLGALGIERSELPVELYDNGIEHVFVMLSSEEQVAALDPDPRALAAFGAIGVNCFAGSGSAWKTRCFVPGLGVGEDPATGSAAGPLALHLARHGAVRFGEEIEIRQGDEVGRPSTLFAAAHGSAEAVERIEVGGRAVVVARGEFRLPGTT
ncbi:MAG: PhzF family phenazine biosynthesis protein [Gaiellaceae bacterium]